MRFVRVILAGAALSLVGCKNLNEAARESFSQSHTCPMDRVEARERKDIRPASLRYPADEKPPPDLASDPGRLKMWQDGRAKDREYYDANYETFEVRGCGFAEFQACSRSSKNMNRASCARYEYPPGMAKWQ